MRDVISAVLGVEYLAFRGYNLQATMKRLPFLFLLAVLSLPAANPTSTVFTARLTSYNMVPGYSAPGVADFRIFVRNNTSFGFDLTVNNVPGPLVRATMYVGQFFISESMFPNVIHFLCGWGPGNPRPTCSPTGYVSNNGGELLASDIFPYGSQTNINKLLDLMRNDLIYLIIYYKDSTGIERPLRGQLIPR